MYNVFKINTHKKVCMAVTRLALSMDESVVQRARGLANARKTSISKLFVSVICLLEEEERKKAEFPPLTKRALGLAKPKDALPDDWSYRDELSSALLGKYS